MKNRSKENGSGNDDWETPKHILEMIRLEYGDCFDPCPIKSDFDGLNIEWESLNYINPPYNEKDKTRFVKKAIFEASKGKTCILLLPVSTETKVFKELWNYAHEIRFLHKRVKFKGYNTKGEYVTDKTGQSGSMLVILNGYKIEKEPIVKLVSHLTDVPNGKGE